MDMGLTLKNIHIALGQKIVIDKLSLVVQKGEVVTLMGPSGVGKSTLLALISGVIDPAFQWSGEITLNHLALTSLPVADRNVGVLFQDALLFPHMSVGENIAFGIRGRHPRREREKLVAQALEDGEMAGFASRDPATLSGGQRARVSLLRCLIAKPDLLLLDEPFSSLDQALRQKMRRFVFDRAKRNQIPTILVTHDPQDATAAGGKVLALPNNYAKAYEG